jgi:glucose/arabinose dehydrogenase
MLITPRFALIALSAAVSALPVTACNGGGGTVGGPGRADTGPVPCPGTCLEASVVLGDASGPGPYPDPDAAPPDAAPPPPPPDVWPPPRPAAQTCTLPEIPPVGAFTTDVAFPALRFPRPIWFGYAPGDGARRYVVGQGGVVWVFEGRQDVEGAAVFLRLPVSRDHNEEGLLGLAFHPRYAENGRFFVYYSDPDGPERRTVLSAFTRADTPEATAASEQRLLLIPQPYGNHKGGSLLFGPDGYLYLGLGDGGSGGDPQNLAQNLESLLGKVLRLDVDLPDEECLTPYGIPADNPFAAGRCAPGAGPGRPEIFAVGVRNPWRMSFDRDTGLLWAGDVGQGEWEEVSVIRRGDNLGWRQVEGEVCYIAGCDPEAFVPPVWVYPHAEGKSITGGFVYRGRAFPELYGAYLYGDYDNGRIWALRVDERGRAENTLLVDTDDHITSFGEDPDGEIYVVTFSDGRAILALRRADAGPAPAPLPATLSQTGCFADVPGHVFAAGVVPYDLNSPLWSDGVDKRRGFALPDGQTARFAPDGHVDFPMGTVLLKTFAEPGGPPHRDAPARPPAARLAGPDLSLAPGRHRRRSVDDGRDGRIHRRRRAPDVELPLPRTVRLLPHAGRRRQPRPHPYSVGSHRHLRRPREATDRRPDRGRLPRPHPPRAAPRAAARPRRRDGPRRGPRAGRPRRELRLLPSPGRPRQRHHRPARSHPVRRHRPLRRRTRPGRLRRPRRPPARPRRPRPQRPRPAHAPPRRRPDAPARDHPGRRGRARGGRGLDSGGGGVPLRG